MPLLAQIELFNLSEMITMVGLPATIMLMVGFIIILLARAEVQKHSTALERAEGTTAALEANAKTQLMVSEFAMKTSEQNADMNAKLLALTESLGEANAKIVVLQEREKLHEERHHNLSEKIEERERTIATRDRTIAELRQQIKVLESQRDALQLADVDKDKQITELNIEIARLKARLELKLQSERRESTQPIPDISQETAPPDETPSDNTPSSDNADEQKDKVA